MLLVMGAACLICATRAFGDNSTLEFTANNGAGGATGGMIKILIKFPEGGSYTGNITIPAGATPAAIATTIKNGINGKFPGTATIQKGDPATIRLNNGTFQVTASNAVGQEENVDRDIKLGAMLKPGTLVGVLNFEANPFNGQDTLLGPYKITTGFADGLLPITFTAPDGDSLSSLTALVEDKLEGAGYDVAPASLTSIDIYGDGAMPGAPNNTVAFDFEMDPMQSVGDQGIDYSISVVPDEPWSVALLGLGIVTLMACRQGFARKVGAGG